MNLMGVVHPPQCLSSSYNLIDLSLPKFGSVSETHFLYLHGYSNQVLIVFIYIRKRPISPAGFIYNHLESLNFWDAFVHSIS